MSVDDRKSLPEAFGDLALVDEGDGIVVGRDSTLALGVGQERVAAGPEPARQLAWLDEGCEAQVRPALIAVLIAEHGLLHAARSFTAFAEEIRMQVAVMGK